MKTSTILPVAVVAGVAQAGIFPDCVNGPLANTTVCNPNASPQARGEALTALMTLQEKISVSGTSGGPVSVPRLGLPQYWWWNEALHGVASSPGVAFSPGMQQFNSATSFPQPILMSAAFDDAMILQVATVVSTEARAFNNYGTVNGSHAGLDFWTPNINPFRDPRWGRGQETPGEDAFRTSQYVRQLIPGLQGTDKYPRIAATCKHYVGYDIEDWEGNDRYGFDAVIDDQDLSEYYTPPFEACVRDSDVLGIMCSYNAYNGIPTCASDYLLQTLLRDTWNFTDEAHWVTSDCDAVQNIYSDHYYAKDGAHAAAVALNAGTDYDCGNTYPQYLGSAYNQSLFNMSTLDRANTRRYSLLAKLGYFDPASIQPYRQLGWSAVNTPASQQLAYEAAVKGITLLKNDGTLPFKAGSAGKPLKIALIGPWANATYQMQGNYAGIAPYLISPLQAISGQAGVSVTYAPGIIGNSASNVTNMGPVTDAASDADVILFIGGIDNSIEAEGMDRDSISWPSAQVDIINALAAYKKPFAVFQMGGGQVDSTFIKQKKTIGSLVWAGYPGQAGGQAIADILFGKVAPAGRLVSTMYPTNYVNQVPMTDMSLRPANASSNSTNPGRTYQWYNKAVYPFGFGTHYTTFKGALSVPGPAIVSNVAFSTASLVQACRNAGQVEYMDQCPFRTVSIEITNTGGYASDYSALLFISGKHGPTPYPLSRLAGYTRLTSIGLNAKGDAQIPITLGNLARADAQGRKVLYPGTYKISLDTTPALASISFTLSGPAVVLEDFPTPPAAVPQAPKPVLAVGPLPAGYKLLGCYVENDSGPRYLATEAYDDGENTPQRCATTCTGLGFSISGAEYSSQCWCANAAPPQTAPSSDCNKPCTGDGAQPCGGTWRATVVQHTG